MPKLTFPKRHKHTDVRSREYLTAAEVTRLRKAARSVGRHGLRNETMILLAYRHGLRVSELITLRWDQFDLDQGFFHVRRLKRGLPSTHPLTAGEIRALRRLKNHAPAEAAYVFLSERKSPLTDSSVRKMIAQAGEIAAVGFPVHPHQLRHNCGFKPTVCPSVASRNPLLYQSLPIIIPFRNARLRRRKDGTDVDTTARGVVERLHRFP